MAYKSQFMMEVSATDKSKAVLSNVQNNLKKTAKSGKKGGAAVMAGWQKAVGALVAVKAAAMAVEAAFAAMNAGREAAIVGSSFKQIHGDADGLIKKLREVSGYAIDDTSLQQLANRWKMAGRDMTVLHKTLPAAYKIAAATGEDYLAVAQKIALAAATGRKSAMERYVGLLDETKAYKDYAIALGDSNMKLTATQKKAALVEAGLQAIKEKYGDIEIDIDVAQLDQVKRKFDNLKSTIDEGWMRMVVLTFNTVAASRADHLYSDLTAIEALAKTTGEHLASMMGGTGATQEKGLEALEGYNVFLAEFSAHQEEFVDGSRSSLLRLATDLKKSGELTKEQFAALYRTIKQGHRQGLEALQVADAMNRIKKHLVQTLKDQVVEEDKLLTLAQTEQEAKAAAIKERSDTHKAAEKYYKLIENKGKLEANGVEHLTALEKLKLKVIEDQIEALRESKTLTAETIAELDMMLLKAQAAVWIRKGVKAAFGGLGVTPTAPKPRGSSGPKKPTLEDAEKVLYSPQAVHASDKRTRETLDAKEKQREIDRIESLKADYLREQAAKVHHQNLLRIAGEVTPAQQALYERNMALDALVFEKKLGLVKDYEGERARIEEVYRARRAKALDDQSEKDRLRIEKDRATLLDSISGIGASMAAAARSGGGANEKVIASLDGLSKGITHGAAVAKKYGATWQGTAAGITTAMGQTAAGVVESERKKAWILAAMETANALAAFATPGMQWSGAAHLAAAAAYGAVALSSGGGKAKPKSVYRAPSAATATTASESGGSTYNIHLSGIMAGTSREFAQETSKLLNGSKGLVYLDGDLIKQNAGNL